MTTSSTKYSWVADLKTGTFLANSRELVRVMGVVTAIGYCSLVDREMLSSSVVVTRKRPTLAEPPLRYNNTLGKDKTFEGKTSDDGPAFLSVTIDDGTDSIGICAPKTTIHSPSNPVTVGKTYDCLLKLKQNREHKTWLAETFVATEHPIDEHLRWLELGHHGQSSSRSAASRLRYSNLCHKFGFPSRKRNRLEAYRLICVNSKLQEPPEEQPQRKKQTLPARRRSLPAKKALPKLIARTPLSSQPHRPRGLQHTTASANRKRRESFKRVTPHAKIQSKLQTPSQPPSQTKTQQPKSLEGLLLKDLATVLQKSEREVQEMIEDLQMEGKIYQNERGEYLPL